MEPQNDAAQVDGGHDVGVDAQVEHIPLIITIGDKEVESKTLAVRTLDGKVKMGIKVDDFIKTIKKNIEEKKIDLEF